MDTTAAPLVEVVYISAARTPFTPAALRTLLARARQNNASLGVSGMLLHADGSFLQILEGPPAAVENLYNTIAKDERHHRILRVFRREQYVRSFAEWTMGFVESDAVMRKQLPGFNDFLHGARGTTGGLDREAVAKIRDLAMQFRAGRWRQHVEASEPVRLVRTA